MNENIVEAMKFVDRAKEGLKELEEKFHQMVWYQALEDALKMFDNVTSAYWPLKDQAVLGTALCNAVIAITDALIEEMKPENTIRVSDMVALVFGCVKDAIRFFDYALQDAIEIECGVASVD